MQAAANRFNEAIGLPLAASGPVARPGALYPERPIRLIIPWTAGEPADGGFCTLADAFRAAAQEPKHLEFLDNMDQPLLLLDGPANRDSTAKILEEERELLRRLSLLPA